MIDNSVATKSKDYIVDACAEALNLAPDDARISSFILVYDTDVPHIHPMLLEGSPPQLTYELLKCILCLARDTPGFRVAIAEAVALAAEIINSNDFK